MTKLHVELAKARKRIEKAVRKHVDCHNITITYSHWDIRIHVWAGSADIIASVTTDKQATTKQIVQQVHKELAIGYVKDSSLF